MDAINRDAILGAKDLAPTEVAVPEWGGMVRVRGLMGHERDSFEQSLYVPQADGASRFDSANIRARLLVRCLVDEKGQRLFGDDDAKALGERSGVVLGRLYEVAQRLSGLGAEELADAVKK